MTDSRTLATAVLLLHSVLCAVAVALSGSGGASAGIAGVLAATTISLAAAVAWDVPLGQGARQ